MINKSRNLIFIILFLFFACNKAEIDHEIEDGNCIALEINDESIWSGPYSGESDTVLFFPDKYSVYWVFIVDRNQMPDTYIHLEGEYGKARYLSFNVYDKEELSSLGSILDKNINPYCDSRNLFTPDNNGNGDLNNYELNIVPSQLDLEVNNQLTFSDTINELIVILRYYIPQEDLKAGVKLPSIKGINATDEQEVGLHFIPATSLIDPSIFSSQLNTLSTLGEGNVIGFWRVSGAGYLENYDNRYLLGVSNVSEDEVAVIKCKPPRFETNFAEPEQVRYWSMNMSNSATFTFNGIKDEDAIISDDGWTYFVFARTNEAIEQACTDSKLNYIEWTMPSDSAFFLYRNLVSNNFAGNLNNVPTIEFGESLISLINKEAKNHIGTFAPRGNKMTIEAFLEKY